MGPDSLFSFYAEHTAQFLCIQHESKIYQELNNLSNPQEMSAHIADLRGPAGDNSKFSVEYESIEPGQQFTWENSAMEINRPKNR